MGLQQKTENKKPWSFGDLGLGLFVLSGSRSWVHNGFEGQCKELVGDYWGVWGLIFCFSVSWFLLMTDQHCSRIAQAFCLFYILIDMSSLSFPKTKKQSFSRAAAAHSLCIGAGTSLGTCKPLRPGKTMSRMWMVKGAFCATSVPFHKFRPQDKDRQIEFQ